jgi:hypothetical protein
MILQTLPSPILNSPASGFATLSFRREDNGGGARFLNPLTDTINRDILTSDVDQAV